ncbi:hypothetical protein F5X99DRAFT_408126 [Biscogniauxia marginata]|nr:hypothetical protein F5X99DRAFT_408126 [Biscogniauxia marginata]
MNIASCDSSKSLPIDVCHQCLKMMHVYMLLAGFSIATSATATFTLKFPPAVGTNIDTQHASPCGGFSVIEDSNSTDWPTGGRDVGVVNVNDSSSIFSLKVAPLSDPSNFVVLYPDITSNIKGDICWPRIRGKADAEWIGQKAIFQLSQYAGNGVHNFQCAAVRFVDGDQAASECRQSG